MADDKRILQLVSNLIQNAIKFTPSGGKILVRVRADKITKTVSLSVQDNGQGIEPALLPQVFDQFKQENMSSSRAYGGPGLGLALCKTIVEHHSGKIKVVSEGRNKGTTVVVHLPLSMHSQRTSLPNSSGGDAKFENLGLRVLIVDDSADSLELFKIWLKKSGAEVVRLESASGVIQLVESFRPHVLLSDISMPGEDGFALIAKNESSAHREGWQNSCWGHHSKCQNRRL